MSRPAPLDAPVARLAAHDAAGRVAPALLLALTGFIALQPMSTDLYLPSLPAIAQHFGLGAGVVQQTLTVFMLGFALSQLVVGPLADRFGRRPVALAGLALHLAGSMTAALAWDFAALLAARLAQAVGVCCTIVCARAVVRDLWEPDIGARVMARMYTWMAIAIAGGPVLGGALQTAFGWRAPFAALACAGGALLLLTLARLPESNRHRDRRATQLAPLARTYREVLGTPAFRAYALLAMFSYSSLFAFLAGSSFVLMRTLGLTAQQYGLGFGAFGASYFVGTLIARRVVARRGLRRTTYPGAAWELACGTVMLALALAGVRHWAAVLGPMLGFIMGHALLQPCTHAGAIARFPRNAGAAAAMLGTVTLAGVLFTPIATWVADRLAPGGHDGVLLLAATVFAGSVGAAATAGWLVRRDGRT